MMITFVLSCWSASGRTARSRAKAVGEYLALTCARPSYEDNSENLIAKLRVIKGFTNLGLFLLQLLALGFPPFDATTQKRALKIFPHRHQKSKSVLFTGFEHRIVTVSGIPAQQRLLPHCMSRKMPRHFTDHKRGIISRERITFTDIQVTEKSFLL